MRINKPLLLTISCFAPLVLAFEFIRARRMPFWCDELLSIHVSQTVPWNLVAIGKTLEGNTSPLYNLILKTLMHWQPLVANLLEPIGLTSEDWLRSLSILPMLFSALYLFVLAYKKSGQLSLLFAISLFFAYLNSLPIIFYMTEVRPYGLWVLFSTVHAHALFALAFEPEQKPKLWKWVGISLALCSLISFGPVQVTIGLIFLLLCGVPFSSVTKLFLAALPGIFYALFCRQQLSISLDFKWPGLLSTYHLFLANARPWMVAGFVSILFLLRNKAKYMRIALAFVVTNAFLFGFLIFVFWLHRTPKGGTDISNRYFLFLVPQFAIALIYGWQYWLKSNSPKNSTVTLACLALGLTSVSGLYSQISDLTIKPNTIDRSLLNKSEGWLKDSRCLCPEPMPLRTKDDDLWLKTFLFARKHNAKIAECKGNPILLTLVIKQQDLNTSQTVSYEVLENETSDLNKKLQFIKATSLCI